MALPARLRLSRLDIGRILRTGRRFFSSLGRASVCHSPAGHGRIVFVISTKVSKKSSERNRIRRALNFWAEKSNLASFKEDIVVSVNPAVTRKTKKELIFMAGEMLKSLTKKAK